MSGPTCSGLTIWIYLILTDQSPSLVDVSLNTGVEVAARRIRRPCPSTAESAYGSGSSSQSFAVSEPWGLARGASPLARHSWCVAARLHRNPERSSPR